MQKASEWGTNPSIPVAYLIVSSLELAARVLPYDMCSTAVDRREYEYQYKHKHKYMALDPTAAHSIRSIFTICLPHILAFAWLSSGKPLTKEYCNGRVC